MPNPCGCLGGAALKEDDKTLGKALFSFCEIKFKTLPNYGTLLCPYIQRLPVIRDTFFPTGPTSDGMLADLTYRKELEVLGCTIVAALCSKSDPSRFPNVHCHDGIAAFLSGKTWNNPDVLIRPNNVFVALMLQWTWDEMQADPFLCKFTKQDWGEQVHNLVFNSKGESRWIIPATMLNRDNLLPMQMMIAMVRFFGQPGDWSNIVAAVQSSWPPPDSDGIAEKLLSIGDRSDPGLTDTVTYESIIDGASGQIGGAVNSFCQVDRITSDSGWQEHYHYGPATTAGGGERIYENDTRDIQHVYGDAVKNWLISQSGSTLQYSQVDNAWINSSMEHLTRPHEDDGGGCCVL